MIKKVLLGLLGLLVLIQFFRIDQSPVPVLPENDIKAAMHPPAEVYQLLQDGCYDCHSNQTAWPWYTNIQPVAWWLQNHVKEARRELNFNEIATYNPKRLNRKMHEVVEQIEQDEMPLWSYTLMHKKAVWTAEQKQKVLEWFKNPVPTNLSSN